MASPLQGASTTSRRQFLQRAGLGSLALATGRPLASLLPARASARNGLERLAAASSARTLTVSFANAAPTLDIATSFVGNFSTIMLLTQEPLVVLNNDLQLVPQLAASWSQPKPSQWLFRLRSGVTFWDGSPLTPDDVVYSLARLIDPKFGAQNGFFFTNMKGVTAAGNDAVLVELAAPDEVFPYVLTLTGIVKKSVAEPRGNHYAEPGTPIVGTGPYQVTSFIANQGVQMTPYPHYWGKRPEAKAMNAQIIPSETDRQLAMRSGSTDMCADVSVSEVRAWLEIPHVAVPFSSRLQVGFMSFDLSEPPWNDIHVRRAVAHCWNPQFVSSVMPTSGAVAESIIPRDEWSGLLGASEIDRLYSSLPKYPFSIAAAKAELAKSSMPHGFTAKIATPSTDSDLQNACVSLSQNLARIGVTLEVSTESYSVWNAYQNAHKKLGLQVYPLGPDYPDPADYFNLLFLSTNAAPNGQNFANFKSPTFDKLFNEQLGEESKARRAAILEQMLVMVSAELAYLPLYWYGTPIAYRADVIAYHDLSAMYYVSPWPDNITFV